MDPPEERTKRAFAHTYSLGDAGKPEHMTVFESVDHNILAVARLKVNDHCFVRRSGGGGTYTFAKVIARQPGPDGSPQIELLVDDIGSTKTIPLDQCGRYVRTLKLSSNTPRDPEQQQHPQRRPTVQRSSSTTTFSQSSNNARSPGQPSRMRTSLHASFQSGLHAPPQRRLQRRSSVHGSFQTGPVNNDNGQQRRASLNRQASFNRQGSLHASFQSGLNNCNLGQEHRQQSLRASFNRPASRRGSSLRSSISTHVLQEKDLLDLDDEFELSSVESESESSDTSNSSSSEDSRASISENGERQNSKKSKGSNATEPISSEEGTPRVSTPEGRNMGNMRDSLKKVSLPGFDDIEFNEQSLLEAFGSISKAA